MEPHIVVGLLLSGLIGLSLGIIGAGGSIVTVPLLVYVMRVRPHEAVAMSLAVVGITALIGAGLHYRRGNVSLRVAVPFAAAGALGALVGARFTALVSARTLMLLFAGLMLLVAGVMLRGPAVSERIAHPPRVLRALAAGLVAGLLTGFLGIGGGFVILPALVLFGGLSMKDAIGTSLAVIAANSAAGLAGHVGDVGFDAILAGGVTVVAALGALTGVMFATRLSAPALRQAFAWFVIAVALLLVARNLPV